MYLSQLKDATYKIQGIATDRKSTDKKIFGVLFSTVQLFSHNFLCKKIVYINQNRKFQRYF